MKLRLLCIFAVIFGSAVHAESGPSFGVRTAGSDGLVYFIDSPNADPSVVCLNEQGRPHAGFGRSGRVAVWDVLARLVPRETFPQLKVHDLVVRADRIFVLGELSSPRRAARAIVILALTPEGDLERRFGRTGFFQTVPLSRVREESDAAYRLAIDGDTYAFYLLEQRIATLTVGLMPVWRFTRFLNGARDFGFGSEGILRRRVGDADLERVTLHSFEMVPTGEALVSYSRRQMISPRTVSLRAQLGFARISRTGGFTPLVAEADASFEVPFEGRDLWSAIASPDGRHAYVVLPSGTGSRLRRYSLPAFELEAGFDMPLGIDVARPLSFSFSSARTLFVLGSPADAPAENLSRLRVARIFLPTQWALQRNIDLAYDCLRKVVGPLTAP